MTDLQQTLDVQRRHIELLQMLSDATAAMSAADTPDEVASAMLTAGLRALGAQAGFLAVLAEDGSTLRVSRFIGYDSIPVEQMQIDTTAALPIATAVRMRTAIFIGSNAELQGDHPELQRIDPGEHACASLPLLAGEDQLPLGAVNVRFDEPRRFTQMDRHMLTTVAQRCAEAMVRARRFSEEQRRRIAAEDALVTSRALEINDDIVQLLAEAKLAFEIQLDEQGFHALNRALVASKRVVASMAAGATTFRRDGLPLDGVRRVDPAPTPD